MKLIRKLIVGMYGNYCCERSEAMSGLRLRNCLGG